MRLICPIVTLPLVLFPSATPHIAKPIAEQVIEDRQGEVSPTERSLRVLDDRNAVRRSRFAAARDLGRLRHVPSIPVLLKNVNFGIGSLSDIDDNPFSVLSDWPCIEALAQFGPEVIAPSLMHYTSPSTPDSHRQCLQCMLQLESPYRTREATLQEIREFGRQVMSEFERQRLIELYFHLLHPGEQRMVPDGWPSFTPGNGGPGRRRDPLGERLRSIG